MPRTLLYYCPAAEGGILDYAWAQANALAGLGVEVTFLAPAAPAGPAGKLTVIEAVRDESKGVSGPRILRWLQRGRTIRGNIGGLAAFAEQQGLRHILISSYVEYGAPFWAGMLKKLRRRGVRIGAVVHDPVRDYIVGPKWFHEWSVRCGYAFLDEAFVHEEVDRAAAGIPDHVRVSVIPHGPYEFPLPVESGAALRQRLEIPSEAKVLLSFGQIRDGKNLDLVIRAMADFPQLWLIVAGKEAGGIQKPVSYYQQLSAGLGVAERCRWLVEYIAPERVGGLFEAADLTLLTYSRRFRSASGVLNAAVQFRRPCLASSGAGPLKTQVERHGLGIWVEPDSEEAVRAGLGQWLGGPSEPRWSSYLDENSWRRNAEVVMQRLFQAND
jgi:glycosyltransferase involved in cell wall biosynthesis